MANADPLGYSSRKINRDIAITIKLAYSVGTVPLVVQFNIIGTKFHNAVVDLVIIAVMTCINSFTTSGAHERHLFERHVGSILF